MDDIAPLDFNYTSAFVRVTGGTTSPEKLDDFIDKLKAVSALMKQMAAPPVPGDG